MEYSRLPRFRRVAPNSAIELTKRDRHIIQLVHRNRFLRSSQIIALIGGSSQSILRRLQLLYHRGYLERPRAQIEYYQPGGSHHMVYGLGNRGAALLRQELGVDLHPLRWGEKNRGVRRIFLDHALLVSEVMVALELSCRRIGHVRLLTEEELSAARPEDRRLPFRWSVNVNRQLKLGVIPDRAFALEFSNEEGAIDRAFFFLEADRGTMPVIRRTLAQTSFYRKLIAYEATWAKGLHRSQFGFHRFRVLTVTKSAARATALAHACSQLKSGHGLFLFSEVATLRQQENIFSLKWKTGRQGEFNTILP